MRQNLNQSYKLLEHAVIYDILKDMVIAASKGQKKRVLSLDRAYYNLANGFYKKNGSYKRDGFYKRNPRLWESYDHCRIGCVTGFGMPRRLKNFRERLIKDAIDSFSKISKPSLEKLSR